jgi:hypothetical protein
MEKQITAVEYLFKTLSHYYKGMEKSYNPLFEKAKEMEKQQQIKFAKWCDNNYNTLKAYNVADLLELYNETFKNK